jgi:predicted amidophosphoribosyltransferase
MTRMAARFLGVFVLVPFFFFFFFLWVCVFFYCWSELVAFSLSLDMSCVNCKAPLKAVAKCCTQCGHRVVVAVAPVVVVPSIVVSNVCPDCSTPLKANAKCCTSCGKRIISVAGPPSPLVSNKDRSPAVAVPSSSSSDVCSQCQFPMKPNAKFCTNCGKKPDRIGGATASSSPSTPTTKVCWFGVLLIVL